MSSHETRQRFLVALGLGAICLPLVLYLPLFPVLLFVFVCAVLYELAPKISSKYEDSTFKGMAVFVCLTTYIVVAMGAAYLVRKESLGLFFLLVFGTIISDTAAYFGGRRFGKTPFFPSISPKKTLEGVICSFVATTLFVWVYSTFFHWYSKSSDAIIVAPVLIVFSAVTGDLLESKLKRFLAVKDASKALGDHGGFADRLDSHIMVFFVLSTFFYLTHYISF